MRGIKFEQYDPIKRACWDVAYENDALKVMQDKDITHNEYLVYIARNNSVIDKVDVFEDGKYGEPPQYTPMQFLDGSTFYRKGLVIKLDFNIQSITKIRVHFVDGLADPLEISIEYIPADREQYYQEKEQQRKLELIEKMNVKHSHGNNLITIRFQNCSDCIDKTRITLFDKSKQLMGVFKVEEGMFYKSIINLAFGTYFYKVSQYDKNDIKIVEADFIEFNLANSGWTGIPFKPIVTPRG